MSDPRFEVRSWRSGDDEALLALHSAAFAGHAPRSAAEWRWKYGAHPLGPPQVMLATERDGTPAAAYCCIPHRIILDGVECRAALQADVAVAPRWHATPTATSLVRALGERCFERFAGGDVRLTWGFPEPPLQRIGLRHLRFEVLRDVNFLVGEAADRGKAAAAPTGIAIERVSRFGAIADSLWARCRDELPIATVRDSRHLDWRYADCPVREHLLLVARGGDGEPRGLAVAREGGWRDDVLSLLDWSVPLADRDAERALVAAARAEAHRLGKRWVVAWFAGAHDLFFRFQRDHGFFVQSTPFQECFRSFHVGARRRRLAERWWQTMGDIDFF